MLQIGLTWLVLAAGLTDAVLPAVPRRPPTASDTTGKRTPRHPMPQPDLRRSARLQDVQHVVGEPAVPHTGALPALPEDAAVDQQP